MSNELTVQKMCIHTLEWQTFLTEIRRYGFKCGYTNIFTGHGANDYCRDKEAVEEEVILFHPENGLIIFASSVWGKKRGNAKIYGQFKKGTYNLHPQKWNFFSKYVVCMKSSKGGMAFAMHFTNNIGEFMQRLLGGFSFTNPWEDGIMPDFRNYMERGSNIIGEEIATKKLGESSIEVRQIIQTS